MLLNLLIFVSFVRFPGISNVAANRPFNCSSSTALNYSEIFRCQNGTDCIHIRNVCDGTIDCADGSDEVQCLHTKARIEYQSSKLKEKILNRNKRQDLNSQRGVCILPQYPLHGTYNVSDQPAVPGATYKFVELSLTCQEGYGVIESDGNVNSNDVHEILCVNGKWSQHVPDCVPVCTLEPDPSVRYMCQGPGSYLFKPCERHVPHGTKVDPSCNAPNYYSHKSFLYMTCLNGSWDYIAKCEPDCGRITPEGAGLIINGSIAKRGELPWHAGIYLKTKNPYKQICAGSLISTNVVISAAHCFWSDVENKLPASNYAVAVGKLHRQWKSEHDQESQESDVRTIMLPERFQGIGTTLQADVAALILLTPIVYKYHVKPVCLNFEKDIDRLQLRNGKSGKMAGWGLTTANGPPSEVLKVVELPFVNYHTCLVTVPKSFQQFITLDKFCAGYTNGTAVCQGDSGGGLAFATTDNYVVRYYLRGVVSASPTDSSKDCNDNTYATFTRIADYEDFIKEAIQESFRPIEAPLLVTESHHYTTEPAVDRLSSDLENEKNASKESDETTPQPTLPVPESDETTPQPTLPVPLKTVEPTAPAVSYMTKPEDVVEATPSVKGDQREMAPWFVTIYDGDDLRQLCTGTIIAPAVVITCAHCIEKKASDKTLLVIAGQLYKTINDQRNVDMQNSTVTHRSSMRRSATPVTEIIVFLKLDRPFTYNSYIQPVTIDFDQTLEESQLQPGRAGKMGGWNQRNEDLDHKDYTYVELDDDILELYSPDDILPKFDASICAGVDKDIDDDDSLPFFDGSGLVFTDNTGGTERHYLRGVLTYYLPCWHHGCPYNFYVIFIKVSSHKKTIINYLRFHNRTVS